MLHVRPWMLGVAALFDAELRAFQDVGPIHPRQVFFDATELRVRIGPFPCTKYEEGVRKTLECLAATPRRGSA